MIFLEEILSVLITPCILWFSLPNSSEKVVDFFREFTVHVDGIGYVCSFAVFDFKRHGKVLPGQTFRNNSAGCPCSGAEAAKSRRENESKDGAIYYEFPRDSPGLDAS